MGSYETPRQELVDEICRLQGLLVDMGDSVVRLSVSNSKLRNELLRTQQERDTAEMKIREGKIRA